VDDEHDEQEPPYRRRYGVLHRPMGRWGRASRLSWINDGGQDAPLTRRDSRYLVTGALVLLLASIAIAAVVRALGG
jgi:hypothetical protein